MKTQIKSLACALVLASLSAVAARAADAKPDAEGYIRDWLMLAPIPLGEDGAGAAFIAKDVAEKEAALKPKEGDKTKALGKEVAWKAVKAKEAIFDFNETLGAAHENAAGYLVAYVVTEKEMTDVTILAGGNDQSRIYLNGVDVFLNDTARTLEKDSDKVEKLTLKKGVNVVILKVINETNNWQACLKFTTKDGKPITDYVVKLAP